MDIVQIIAHQRKRQGISESTIFKHYKTKNELILAVLDYFSQYDQAIIESLGLKEAFMRLSIVSSRSSHVNG